ncbi:hypothetical protein HMPREF0872_05655 [Veillonella montpellierensis DNF00314]|uniref:Uncharacterized protein n=1 Tax=Veillonella montpellierensis DNF00314 TaxID=1401067 RepID=A0A096BWR2_9FIRM|nr:OmpH family outer membrane protein [Veillonella montpellierensis]KGF47162.1 hypothetical protein HMPREF0872_05655 [Veillonella montpellierensis DNF00314]
MNKRYSKLMILGAMMMGVVSVAGCGHQDKIGYIDSNKVIAESTKGQEITQKLNAKHQEIMGKIKAAEDSQNQEEIQKAYAAADQEYQIYAKAMKNDLQTYMERNIGEVAKEQGVTVVVDKNAVGGGGVDVTDALLKKIGTAKPAADASTSTAPADTGSTENSQPAQ